MCACVIQRVETRDSTWPPAVPRSCPNCQKRPSTALFLVSKKVLWEEHGLVHFSKYVAGSNRLLGSCYYCTMCNCCHCFIAMQIIIFQLPYKAKKQTKKLVYITSRLHHKWSQKTLTQKFPRGGMLPDPPQNCCAHSLHLCQCFYRSN